MRERERSQYTGQDDKIMGTTEAQGHFKVYSQRIPRASTFPSSWLARWFYEALANHYTHRFLTDLCALVEVGCQLHECVVARGQFHEFLFPCTHSLALGLRLKSSVSRLDSTNQILLTGKAVCNLQNFNIHKITILKCST